MAIGKQKFETVKDPNVVPMADVMLVLLIIFMVVTPMLQKGVSVELAHTQHPTRMQEADREDAVVVAVTRDGTVWLQQESGTDRVKSEELAPRIRDLLANRLDKTVYIKSDARARYGDVVDAVDNIRAAGVDRLGMLTEKVDEAGRVQQAM
jgi:biopolymer transport protein ExbD